MLSLCMLGFSPGTLASSNSPEMWLLGSLTGGNLTLGVWSVCAWLFVLIVVVNKHINKIRLSISTHQYLK